MYDSLVNAFDACERQDGQIKALRRLLRVYEALYSPLPPNHPARERAPGEASSDPFGFPLRLRTATKIGFKNAKWITAIEVTNTFPDTFWRKEGFSWFAGI